MRLIDADALRKEIRELPNEAKDCSYLDLVDREVVQALISEAPTVERTHGVWIYSPIGSRCSTCKATAPFNPLGKEYFSPFCMECGASMRKEGENNDGADA